MIMRIKPTFIMLATLLVCMWSAAPSMAQKQKGHTGGLGESRIQLNLASPKNLVKAPGITESIAEAIVKYRQEKGPFKKPEDLLKVPGITKEVFTQIKPQVGAEGDLYTLPRPGEALEEEDEDAPLSPSKC
ncbi:MAG: helix-hairpin-helix domain-containing protein [Deltaproteobacteria bacterium]|nr:helix-hairpin-helix domain-containing protein [Deltaproteobacteria bacterium]